MPHSSITTATKLGYGVGQLADGVKQAAFSSFLFFYYNQVLGLSGSLAGTAALLSLLIDGIVDPMVGQFSDRFRSRWGRRHPFMLVGALLFAAAMYALFSPPRAMGFYQLFLWMLGWAIVVRILHTLFYVPHLSLGAEMVRDYHARTSLISYRIFFAFAGTLITSVAGFALFFPSSKSFPNGLLNATNYPLFGLSAGLLASVAMFISIFSTRSAIRTLSTPSHQPNARSALLGFITVFETLRLQSFRVLFAAMLIFMVISGGMTTLSVYIATYNYGFGPQELAIITAAPILGVIFGPKIATALPIRIDKKLTLTVSVVGGAFIATLPLTLYLLGLYQILPPGLSFMLVFLCMGFGNGFFMSYIIVFDSMLSDTIDEHELLSGRREEGLFFAARALAQKASYGFGSFFAGVALDIIHFPRNANPAEVSQHTLDGLAAVGGPVTLAIYASTILFSNMYRLNAQRHATIMKEIAARETL